MSRWPQLAIVLAAARRDGCGLRRNRAAEARAKPGDGNARRPRLLAGLRVRARRGRDLHRAAEAGDGDARHPRPGWALDPHDRAQAQRAGRTRLVHVGRPRQPRSRRVRGHLSAARPAGAKRPHDRASEPDAGGHDRAGDLARPRLPARLLARLGRSAGSRDRLLPHRRARARGDARRRSSARAEQVPAAGGQARLVRTGERARGASRQLRDPAARGRSRREPLTFAPGPSRCVSASSSSRARRSRSAPGRRFSVRVRTDAESYRWLFAGRRGAAERQVLVLRAPEEPGTYTLYVTVGGRAASARVDVLEPE